MILSGSRTGQKNRVCFTGRGYECPAARILKEMEKYMNPNSKTIWTRVIFTLLMTVTLGLSLMPLASASDHGDVKKV